VNRPTNYPETTAKPHKNTVLKQQNFYFFHLSGGAVFTMLMAKRALSMTISRFY
jgi:hypothetical protein